MPSIRRRAKWEVRVSGLPDVTRQFRKKSEAQAYAGSLAAQGLEAVQRQSPEGRWEARVRRTGFPCIAKHFASRRDAEEWARLQETNIDQCLHVDPRAARRTTLGELLLKFRESLPIVAGEKHPDWYRIGKMSRHRICQVKMAALAPIHFCQYRDERLKEAVPLGPGVKQRAGTKIKLTKPTTVIKELDLFRRIINLAEGLCGVALAVNPANSKKVPRPEKQEGHERKRRFQCKADGEDNEEIRLKNSIAKATSPHLGNIVQLAVETAMRRGEMLGICWRDVDLDRGCIRIPAEIAKNGRERLVPLTGKAHEILAAIPGKKPHLRVFEGATRYSLRNAFRRATARAGLEDFHFHDLRHEAASRLFEETDLREAEIMLVTGHADPRMLVRYTHLRPDTFIKRFRESWRHPNSTDLATDSDAENEEIS